MTFEQQLNTCREAIFEAERMHGFGSPEYDKAQAKYFTHRRKGPKPVKYPDRRWTKKARPSFTFERASA